VHPYGYIGFYSVMGGFDTVPNSSPVNVFEQGNGRSGHPTDHPGNLIAEVRSETASAIRPGDIFCLYTVFGAFDPLGSITNMDRNAVEIRSTPGGFCAVFYIVPRAFLHTDRA